MPKHRSSLACLLVAAAAALSACKDDPPPQRTPPPPVAKPATCEGGGGKVSDAASAPFFPGLTGPFCLDPNGETKTFGEGASAPIERICDVFDGECEIYRRHGVKRVVELRYVDGRGSPATIDLHLSKFATAEGAYAMLTQRIVGDGDPADEATPKPIAGGGVAALGLGNAYVWRGPYLVELTYNDESAAEAAIRAAGDEVLPPLARAIGDKLQGETAPPASVAALPKEGLLPLGVRLVLEDALGVPGFGACAYGFYRDGDKRYRLASVVKDDADQANDALSALAKLPGAAREKNVGDGAVRVLLQGGEGAAVEWLVAATGKRLLGIGDEARVLRAGMTPDEHARVSLAKEEKTARLKKALAGG